MLSYFCCKMSKNIVKRRIRMNILTIRSGQVAGGKIKRQREGVRQEHIEVRRERQIDGAVSFGKL